MNGIIAVQGMIRGLHDVFAAVWAGGLLVMVLVIMPTMRIVMRTARSQTAGVTGQSDPGNPRTSGVPLLVANAAVAVMVLMLSGVIGTIGA